MPPPFDTPVTNTRAAFTHAARSSWASERSSASTSFGAPATEPLMFQNAFGPAADGYATRKRSRSASALKPVSRANCGPVSPAPCSASTSGSGRYAPRGACRCTARTPSGVSMRSR
jgi:hypothetical protein